MTNHSTGLGTAIIIIAIMLLLVGIVVWAVERGYVSPARWKLPGDIRIVKGPVYIWIPLGLSILLSVVATILLNLFRK